MAEIVYQSTLTCPHCGHSYTETMPTDVCRWQSRCPACQQTLRALPGDCCIYCSYGDVPCPPRQRTSAGPSWSL